MSSILIDTLPFLYVNGLQLAWVSTTTLTVNSGTCRDSTDIADISLGALTTINGAVNGINGLDTGALANSTLYNVYAISSTQNLAPTGLLLTVAGNTPTLPFNYDVYRHIGWVRTDGSAHFLKFYQTGNGSTRSYQYDVPIAVLTGGNQTSTFLAQSLAAAVPLNTMPVQLSAVFTPATAGNTANIRTTGSSAAAGSCPVILDGQVAAVAARYAPFKFIPQLSSGNPSFDFVVSNSSDALTVLVVGFEDLL